ncbi:hypothetical protein C8A01DRAFT_13307 [Parachaetomium inaequale]|uniref:Alpha/beta-hydrolase n=1 Tax=Parachaetomium inaequale TaxID=2588326 RepID=A0AAN6PPW9_9PEZI|nr:hypothetical protein C8A01DRAFT_13307 [Parachaetomium inaequale]
MSPWLRFTRAPSLRCVVVQPRKFHPRLLSTHSSAEHVRVPCASAGAITVSLHNIAHHDTGSPLVILIPPFSQPGPNPITPVPSCFHDYPTAVINYRWQPQDGDERPEYPLHWPTPLHDVNFGYSWIMDNLGSGIDPSTEPRPAYVYGSYLGASLAAGLALTESHVPARSQPMTIRGLMAHNGIYNWTMFLPDHPIHKLKAKPNSNRKKRGLQLPFAATTLNDDNPIEEEGIFTDLKHLTPDLFADPSNLFDPFASACLFFHSANLHVPDDFTTPLSATSPSSALTADFTAAIDALANHSSPSSPEGGEEEDTETAATLLTRAAHLAKQQKPPRKGYLVFPPRNNSTLRLPATLLIHSQPQPATPQSRTGRSSKSRNSFAVQASELAGLMLRSLDMHEFRSPRRGSGPAPWEWEAEETVVDGGDSAAQEEWERWRGIERRVQSLEVEAPSGGQGGERGLGLGLDEKAGEVVGEWLRERIDGDFGDFGGEGEAEGR